MTLNDIFRRTGEPTYYTPTAVYGTLIENQRGGQVTVINPPFAPSPKPRRWWKRSWRFFGRWYVTLSNCRVKKRPTDGYTCNHNQNDIIKRNKQKLYDRQQGHCPMCGKPFDLLKMEYHHVLPWGRFPDLRLSIRNAIVLCHACHKEVHCNPYLNIRMQEQKAQELGIDLKDRYDYGKEDYQQGCEDNATATD